MFNIFKAIKVVATVLKEETAHLPNSNTVASEINNSMARGFDEIIARDKLRFAKKS